MIRVLIVDDNDFVRSTLTVLLDQTEGITVVGECRDGSEVSAAAATTRPDVVLMDVQMPELSGIDATSELTARQPDVRVVMVSGRTNARSIADAARAGAAGYLQKGCTARTLVDAVRQVAAGGTAWPGNRARSGRPLVAEAQPTARSAGPAVRVLGSTKDVQRQETPPASRCRDRLRTDDAGIE